MKKVLAIIIAALMLASTLCSCGDGNSADPTSTAASTADAQDKKSETTPYPDLTRKLEVAATEPRYLVSAPDGWKFERHGIGLSLYDKDYKKYSIVVASASALDDSPLEQAFTNLYNHNFNYLLDDNYQAEYADFALETTEVKLNDGTPALRFEGNQSADEYGTKLSFPVYGYGFICDGMPFIIASVVMDESEADSAKQAEMKGYVDEMINTVHVQQ